MAPEYGATCGLFPIDAETIRYLELTGRPPAADRAGRGIRQGPGDVSHGRLARGRVFRHAGARPGDRRAQPGRPAAAAGPGAAARLPRQSFQAALKELQAARPAKKAPAPSLPVVERFAVRRRRHGDRRRRASGRDADAAAASITHGSVVIAAITSCTNTSNPSVMVAAGLLAKKAVERGLETKPWVKASLAPGLEGRHRLPARRRARHVPRPASLQPGRLRLHDLHRQLGPAARGDQRGDPAARPGRRRRL